MVSQARSKSYVGVPPPKPHGVRMFVHRWIQKSNEINKHLQDFTPEIIDAYLRSSLLCLNRPTATKISSNGHKHLHIPHNRVLYYYIYCLCAGQQHRSLVVVEEPTSLRVGGVLLSPQHIPLVTTMITTPIIVT